ncbi:MAG: tetratricopeptide repeat protein [Deltaproteobacteria bacterium]
MPEKQPQSSNRIRETLGRLYEHQPPHFREYMRRYQEDPTSRVFAPLAEAYRRLGRIDEAIDICIEGLKHHPDFPGGRVALARCFMDKKKYSRAKDELIHVVGISPDNILAQRLLGDSYFSLNEMHQALRCYKMAVVLSPEDVGLQDKIHKLEQQFARGDFDGVGELSVGSERAPSIDPSSSSPVSESPGGLERQASQEQEADELEFVSVQSPSDVAQSLESFSPEAPALERSDFSDELEALHEDSEENEMRKAKIEAILGFEDEKEEVFKTESVSEIFSEEVQPTTEITTQTLGDLYYSQGQFEKSLKIFEKIHKTRPTAELAQKIQKCRSQLGVDDVSLRRQQKIDVLNAILVKTRKNR